MAEMENDCSTCIHAPICKYAEAFKKFKDDIIKIANNHLETYGLTGLMDLLSIRCRQYKYTIQR